MRDDHDSGLDGHEGRWLQWGELGTCFGVQALGCNEGGGGQRGGGANMMPAFLTWTAGWRGDWGREIEQVWRVWGIESSVLDM